MVVRLRQGTVDVGEHVPGRDDVEEGHPGDHLGVVEAQPVGDPGAAVVADDREALEAELAHEPDLVGGHRPLGVRRVVGRRGGAGRVAVPTQVGEDHRVPVGEPRRDAVPHDVGLRVAVQQQDRRAVTTHLGVDARPVDVDVMVFPVLEHGTCLPPPDEKEDRSRRAADADRTGVAGSRDTAHIAAGSDVIVAQPRAQPTAATCSMSAKDACSHKAVTSRSRPTCQHGARRVAHLHSLVPWCRRTRIPT